MIYKIEWIVDDENTGGMVFPGDYFDMLHHLREIENDYKPICITVYEQVKSSFKLKMAYL